MAFGFELRNENGDIFMTDEEDVYMYWGKFNVGNTYVKPFNIPSSVKILAFHIQDLDDTVMVQTTTSGYHSFRSTLAENQTLVGQGTGTVYIFVHSASYPRGTGYGLEIFKPDGTIQFHAAAPPIRVSQVFNTIPYTGGTDITTSTRVAVPTIAVGILRYLAGSVQHREWESRAFCWKNGSTYHIGTRRRYFSFEDSPVIPNQKLLGNTFNMIGLDAGYFDGVPSRGDY